MHAALLVGAIAVLLGYLARYPRYRFCFPLAFVVIAVFLSIRYMWGNDMPVYYNWFHSLNDYHYSFRDILSMRSEVRGGEIGWTLLNWAFKPFGFLGLQVFLSVLQNAVIYKFIKDNVSRDWYWLSIFIYCFSSNLMVLSASMLRQFLAMIIFITAGKAIIDRNALKYFALIIIASLIHKSAVILIPFFLVGYMSLNFTKKSIIYLLPILLVWFILSDKLLAPVFDLLVQSDELSLYSNYSASKGVAFGTGLGFLFNLFIFIFIYIHLNRFPRHERIFLFLSIVAILFVPMSNLSRGTARLSFYFEMFSIISYPILMNSVRINKTLKSIVLAGVVLLTIKGFFSFFYSDVWHKAFFEYHTIFERMY